MWATRSTLPHPESSQLPHARPPKRTPEAGAPLPCLDATRAPARHSAAAAPQGRQRCTHPPCRRSSPPPRSRKAPCAQLRRRAAIARPHHGCLRPTTPFPARLLREPKRPSVEKEKERGSVGAPRSQRSAPSPLDCDLQHLDLGFEPLAEFKTLLCEETGTTRQPLRSVGEPFAGP